MNIRNRRDCGFTVIELLVVIVVVCILGVFVALAYSGVQAKNRNVDRQKSIDTLKKQLENYYATAHVYPTLGNMNDGTWRAQNMKQISANHLQDPRWVTSNTFCTAGGHAVLTTTPTANCYSYQVTSADGSACDNASHQCAHYTLTASLEGGEKYVKSSLN